LPEARLFRLVGYAEAQRMSAKALSCLNHMMLSESGGDAGPNQKNVGSKGSGPH
jgi:hypothetical protein